MAVIKKKTWPESFALIFSGKKGYDLRLGDFTVQEGDTIVFEEWDPTTKAYTGRSIEKRVTYVSKFKVDEIQYWPKEEIEKQGLQILSLK